MSRFLREENLVDFEDSSSASWGNGNQQEQKLLYVAGLNFTENYFPKNDWN
eukprot:gene35526-43799_t